ncbi:zinc ribbon domain-containing protein [Lysinibacillus antri]|uniref:Zinc ribbon domain-containing protein n=1 Tax=Lysinibacillus antri TaxID=2498145 RepID=A0A3S0P7A5_9BACI|nr:zinc ribbon domain-containing protein [Lysinibacillus antri]RUL55096.1 zinc ribbon domain-containing protein [Lysinibacillus antri]
MIETNKRKGIDLKDVKQRLNASNEQRLELIVRLGEATNNMLRHNEEDLTPLHQLSDQLLNLDIEIYQLLCTLNELSTNNQHCINCQQALVENAKFCGNCGTSNPNFKDATVPQVNCYYCKQLIDEPHMYCPCCGVKQEGM